MGMKKSLSGLKQKVKLGLVKTAKARSRAVIGRILLSQRIENKKPYRRYVPYDCDCEECNGN